MKSSKIVLVVPMTGTASNNPSPTRGVSSTCFRFEKEVWMFDSGEGTQVQLMKSQIKAGKITKVFLTHLHGDHIFGLPGLMCTIGQNIVENKTLDIYGPLGIRKYIRTCLELSRSYVTYKYSVHEMIPLEEQIPEDIREWKCVENDDSILHPSEVLGTQIKPDESGVWHLFENDLITVKSSWIKHRIPSFGFVLEQKSLPGKLDVEGLKALGIGPGPIYAKIKAGHDITFNGKTIKASAFLGPSRVGKKVAILGDCYESSASMAQLAKNSDVLIHESTLEDAFQQKAITNGHSTPSMASNFAKLINAKCLILNHFSQRYKPLNYVSEATKPVASAENAADEDDIIETVQKLIDEAKLVFEGPVLAAYDFFSHKV